MRTPPNPADILEVYIDESSQNDHRYLVLGGVGVMMLQTGDLDAAIEEARGKDLPQGEAKWTKVSKLKLPAYKRTVDVLFRGDDLVHFHCLVVDTTKLDHGRFNEGSRDIGFNKEIYQLATKFSRIYSTALFHVYPDHRETSQNPEDLRLIRQLWMPKTRR
jgi:hypothetical protein